MENRSKGIIIILSVLLIVAGVAAVYFGISLSGMETKLDNLENKVDNGTTNNENKQTSDKIQVKEESVDNTSNMLESTEKIVSKHWPNFEEGKCLNASKKVSYNISRTKNFLNYVSATLKDNGETVEFNVSWDEVKDIYPDLDKSMTEYKEYSISNFSKKVVNVYIEGMGNGIGNEVVYFLMEDGTVEYMPIHKALKAKEFKSYGKIENVSDIVDILKGGARYDADGQGNGPGWLTVFAINNEGNYYDIGAIVQEKIN